MNTEPDDLARLPALPAGMLTFDREARLLASRRDLLARLRLHMRSVRLIADELLHPAGPCDLIVRRGNLRLSELLDDGREVTRAVLQAGAACRVRDDMAAVAAADGEDSSPPVYSVARMVMMALGETELWVLPAGALDPERPAGESTP